MGKNRKEFVHQFEGPQALQSLLEIAGARLNFEETLAALKNGLASGQSPANVFPALFDEEPHFPDPEIARALYQNLFGLWELLVEGKPWNPEPKERPPRPKKRVPMTPAPFAPGEPDEAFVEAAWRYLEDAERERNRLQDGFENRQDALLQFLDEQNLSDDGYGVARHLLFELHAMIELGWPNGLRSVSQAELSGEFQSAEKLPQSLVAYSDEALFEAEQDEEAPLPKEESARVRALVAQGLRALWNARKA